MPEDLLYVIITIPAMAAEGTELQVSFETCGGCTEVYRQPAMYSSTFNRIRALKDYDFDGELVFMLNKQRYTNRLLLSNMRHDVLKIRMLDIRPTEILTGTLKLLEDYKGKTSKTLKFALSYVDEVL